jgi:glycerol kinase
MPPARAILCGISRGTTRGPRGRAALESIAQQNADVLDAMPRTSKSPYPCSTPTAAARSTPSHAAAGGPHPCRVNVAAQTDLSAMGVGLMIGQSAGVFDRFIPSDPAAQYAPQMPEDRPKGAALGWAEAVRRAR